MRIYEYHFFFFLKAALQHVTKIWFYDSVGLVWIAVSVINWGAAFKSQPRELGQSSFLLHALIPGERW